jgi:hypothetical protein
MVDMDQERRKKGRSKQCRNKNCKEYFRDPGEIHCKRCRDKVAAKEAAEAAPKEAEQVAEPKDEFESNYAPTEEEISEGIADIVRPGPGRPNKGKDRAAVSVAAKARHAATMNGWRFDKKFLPVMDQIKRDHPCAPFSPLHEFLHYGEFVNRGIEYRKESVQNMDGSEVQAAWDEDHNRPFTLPEGSPIGKNQKYMCCFVDAAVHHMTLVARHECELDDSLTQLLRETIVRTLKWKEQQEKIHAEKRESFSFDYVEEITQTLRDIDNRVKLYVGPLRAQGS